MTTRSTTTTTTATTAIAAAAAAMAGACSASTPAEPGVGVVTHIVDGDTIEVAIGGRVERVRLLGIDTPEIAHEAFSDRPATEAECYGGEATEFVDDLVPPGTEVSLIRDVVPRDDYGRLLAYVYRHDDGTFVNVAIVRHGYGLPLSIGPNTAHAGDVVAAARRAEADDVGLWRDCSG